MNLPEETLLGFFGHDPSINITPILGKVGIPTLIGHGTEDRIVPFADGQFLAENIPDAQLYPFKDLGHLPIFTAPGEFCEVLDRFVKTGTVPAPAGG